MLVESTTGSISTGQIYPSSILQRLVFKTFTCPAPLLHPVSPGRHPLPHSMTRSLALYLTKCSSYNRIVTEMIESLAFKVLADGLHCYIQTNHTYADNKLNCT